SKWNVFEIHQLLGFPEEGLIDGKFLCLLYYETKLASLAMGAPCLKGCAELPLNVDPCNKACVVQLGYHSKPHDNLKTPVDVRVTKSTASGYSITSRLSWSYQESGVQVLWSPPAHASPANKVLQYQVSVMEDLFHLETKPIRSQRIVRSVDGACFDSTSSAKNPAPPPEFVELKKKALQLLKKSSDPYELPYESVHIEEVIGQGAFAVVHRAYAWIGKVRETVAVKTLKRSFTPEEKRGLLQEIELLKLVGPHPNIVSLRACCTTGSVMALLLEYCPLGDLKTYLTKIRGRDEEFLASKKIVHRDLAARNILLLSKQQVKIADLGLSRDAYEEGLYRKTTAGRLPVRWMAVESLSHFTYTPMSDVWSFGVLMWEVMTLGAVPYPGVNNHEVLQYLLEGNRLNRPSDCAQDVYDIMASCWNTNPISRPCFGQIIQSMDSIMEKSLDYFHFD
ncbi:hypothetical protein HPB47_019008, partial [Ixodes persulcatus]